MTKFPRRDFLTLLFLTLLAPHVDAAAPDAPDPEAAVPTLDELAGKWMEASTLRSLPALNSARGSGQATPNLLAVGNLSFPPLTVPGTIGDLQVDGQDVLAQQCRWSAYQVERRAVLENLLLESQVRLPYEQNGLLFRLELTNHGTQPRVVTVDIALPAAFSSQPAWGWHIPRQTVRGHIAEVTDRGTTLEIHPALTGPWSLFRFAQTPTRLTAHGQTGQAHWTVTLPPGQTQRLEIALAVAPTHRAARVQAGTQAQAFDAAFRQVQADWQDRFEAMFRPGNPYFSGSLPRLVTPDPHLSRIYYISLLSLLCVCRTSFPIAPRVYVTNTPEDNCIMMYFWDTREVATVLALLDPLMLRRYLADWLARGVTSGYAEEFLTGTMQGPWYSANDLSLFTLLNTYLNVTEDQAFLNEVIRGQTVQQHMEALATHWKALVRPGRALADYGAADNLLECVPTYTHEVASFNAANVWMMRRVAALAAASGEAAHAAALRADAARLLPAVLALYVPGQGVWDARHEDGTRVPVRHVLDFITVGQCLTSDLTPTMRAEMMAFVQRELLVDHWMRAQSLSDLAAAFSDRPDHGPKGAFTAWPAETIATFSAFGCFIPARDFLRRCATVTTEGPFSQSRELLTQTPDTIVRIASRGDQTYNASCGGSFAETVLRSLFGYQPDFLTSSLIPDLRPRGFEGTLFHVRTGNRFHHILSDHRGLHLLPATPL